MDAIDEGSRQCSALRCLFAAGVQQEVTAPFFAVAGCGGSRERMYLAGAASRNSVIVGWWWCWLEEDRVAKLPKAGTACGRQQGMRTRLV